MIMYVYCVLYKVCTNLCFYLWYILCQPRLCVILSVLLTSLEAGINLFLVWLWWCYWGPSVLSNNALVISLCLCWVRVESATNPALSFSPPGPGPPVISDVTLLCNRAV